MEAKDTVMNKEDLVRIYAEQIDYSPLRGHRTIYPEDRLPKVAQAQAEISFRAGEKTEQEKLVEKFNQWADERIEDAHSVTFLSAECQERLGGRIDAFCWAKVNLKRLAKEVKG